MTKSDQASRGWEWNRTVSILGNPLVLGSLFKAFGIAIGALWLLLEIISWTMKTSMTLYVLQHPMKVLGEAKFAIGFVFFLAVISAIAVAIVFRNGYDAHFGINEDGVWMTPQQGQRETNEGIHKLLFGLGVVLGKPGAAGTAMIADATQDKSIAWSDVAKIEPYPSRYAIGFHDSWHCVLIVYCLPEQYDAVLQYAQSRVRQ